MVLGSPGLFIEFFFSYKTNLSYEFAF